MELVDVLPVVMCGRCPKWETNATFVRLRCDAVFADLDLENPDVPPSINRPRIVRKYACLVTVAGTDLL